MTIANIPGAGLWGAIASLLNGNFNDLKERMGWADYNDVATIASPIALTLADTDYKLTNDGAGANTRSDFQITAHGDIWDVVADQFNFSSLKVGDLVTIRSDITMHSSGPTRDFRTTLVLGVGSGTEVELPVAVHSFKTAGDHRRTVIAEFYIGAAFVQTNPAELRIQSDNTGDTVTVTGWFIKTEVR